MNGEPQLVAMPQRVNLRLVTRAADEGIVARYGPVVAQAQDLAVVAIRILGQGASGCAGSHEDHACAVKHDARSTQNRGWFAAEQILDVGQPRAIQAPASQRGLLLAVLGRFAVGEVNQLVLGELRMQRDVDTSPRCDSRIPSARPPAAWDRARRRGSSAGVRRVRSPACRRWEETPGSRDAEFRARPLPRESWAARRWRRRKAPHRGEGGAG